MKLMKSLLLLALLGGFTLQASGSENEVTKERQPQGFILGDIIIKRPPVNDDGPGGPGR